MIFFVSVCLREYVTSGGWLWCLKKLYIYIYIYIYIYREREREREREMIDVMILQSI